MAAMFQKKFDFEKRLQESTRIRARFPERVPVIIERAQCSRGDIDDIDKHKYLVPGTTSMSQLMFIIRKRIPNLAAEKSIFLFVDETKMPPTSATLMTLDEEHRNRDGFLYITYAGENTFG